MTLSLYDGRLCDRLYSALLRRKHLVFRADGGVLLARRKRDLLLFLAPANCVIPFAAAQQQRRIAHANVVFITDAVSLKRGLFPVQRDRDGRRSGGRPLTQHHRNRAVHADAVARQIVKTVGRTRHAGIGQR